MAAEGAVEGKRGQQGDGHVERGVRAEAGNER